MFLVAFEILLREENVYFTQLIATDVSTEDFGKVIRFALEFGSEVESRNKLYIPEIKNTQKLQLFDHLIFSSSKIERWVLCRLKIPFIQLAEH